MLSAVRAPKTGSASPTDPLLTTTVPREYVHRAAVAEVLLTGWEPAATATSGACAAPGSAETVDAFAVRAQWPRAHALFTATEAHQDPMLMVESIRQTGSLLAHAAYEVPFGHQFLMWDMSFTADARAFATAATPTEVELRTTCRTTLRRGGGLASMRYTVSVLREGDEVASGSASYSCTSPAVHRRLRGDRPFSTGRALPAPVDPASVGRASGRDVLLGAPERAGEARWELRVDTGHPVLFDHPVDHVPGMVLIEAGRQAARAVTSRPHALLLGMESRFPRYAELDAPCFVTACVEGTDASGAVHVRTHCTQQGEEVFTALLTLGPASQEAERPAGTGPA
ncbi:ScbA/BarX family gamma-butyrolactone biosynthesis protein [Streptomyces bauhiniae]|uniref:ScbA/BarX family gamma-butyrolactone biosynthesis protein n=1 Tax=Streptomyces bauhiniae TaxID=2340725 RepID=UPI0033A57F22